jgi:hypothetical protein
MDKGSKGKSQGHPPWQGSRAGQPYPTYPINPYRAGDKAAGQSEGLGGDASVVVAPLGARGHGSPQGGAALPLMVNTTMARARCSVGGA